MPAYMVKSIRSYERTPHNAVGTNREKTEKKELVMDVRLKKDDRTPGESGDWSPLSQSQGLADVSKAAVDYDYDRATGARSVRPINVYGDWNADLSAGVDFPIDKAEKWRVKENASWRYDHSTVRYSIGSSYLNNTTELLYQPTSKFSLGLKSGIHHRYSTSVSEDFSTIRVLDYDYGASVQVRLPWDVQLSTDLTMYSRRGYSDDVMNTDELVWNARLSKMLLKGRLAVHLDAFDILGQISNVKYSVNAQGRTETYQNVMPPYAMLRLSWRLGKTR